MSRNRNRNSSVIATIKEQEAAATETANNEHLHNANNDYEQNVNNEYEQNTDNKLNEDSETEEKALDVLDEANNALYRLLHPNKFNDKKEPPKEMKGIYFEDVVLANLVHISKRYKKGFLSAFVNEAVKKELIAQDLFNPKLKNPKKK